MTHLHPLDTGRLLKIKLSQFECDIDSYHEMWMPVTQQFFLPVQPFSSSSSAMELHHMKHIPQLSQIISNNYIIKLPALESFNANQVLPAKP